MSRGERRVDSATPALVRRHPLRLSRNVMTGRGQEGRLYDRLTTLARDEGQRVARRLSGTSDRVLKLTFAME